MSIRTIHKTALDTFPDFCESWRVRSVEGLGDANERRNTNQFRCLFTSTRHRVARRSLGRLSNRCRPAALRNESGVTFHRCSLNGDLPRNAAISIATRLLQRWLDFAITRHRHHHSENTTEIEPTPAVRHGPVASGRIQCLRRTISLAGWHHRANLGYREGGMKVTTRCVMSAGRQSESRRKTLRAGTSRCEGREVGLSYAKMGRTPAYEVGRELSYKQVSASRPLESNRGGICRSKLGSVLNGSGDQMRLRGLMRLTLTLPGRQT